MKKPNKIIKANGGKKPQTDDTAIYINPNSDGQNFPLYRDNPSTGGAWDLFSFIKDNVFKSLRLCDLMSLKDPGAAYLTVYFVECTESFQKLQGVWADLNDAIEGQSDFVRPALDAGLVNKAACFALNISQNSLKDGSKPVLFTGLKQGRYPYLYYLDIVLFLTFCNWIAVKRVERYCTDQATFPLGYSPFSKTFDYAQKEGKVDHWKFLGCPTKEDAQQALNFLELTNNFTECCLALLLPAVLETSLEIQNFPKKVLNNALSLKQNPSSRRKQLYEFLKSDKWINDSIEDLDEIKPGIRIYSYFSRQVFLGLQTRLPFSIVRAGKPGQLEWIDVEKITKDYLIPARRILQEINIADISTKVDASRNQMSSGDVLLWGQRIEQFKRLEHIYDALNEEVHCTGWFDEANEADYEKTLEGALRNGEIVNLIPMVEDWVFSKDEGALKHLETDYMIATDNRRNHVTTTTIPQVDHTFELPQSDLAQELSDVLLKIADIAAGRTGLLPGDCYIFWQQSDLAKEAPAMTGLMNHITKRANDIPYRKYGKKGQDFPKGADSWKNFLLTWGKNSLNEKSFNKKKSHETGAGKPTPYYAAKGRGMTKCDAMKVAKKMVELCDHSEIQDRIDSWKTTLKM